jgi:5-methylcytosine-specific restriction endonuclease McrA
VLVLNRLWQPVNMCSARRAITLVFLGHAHVVGTDEDDQYFTHDVGSWMDRSTLSAPEKSVVRSISHQFLVPEIIVLSLFDRLPKKQVKFTRENIYRRDAYRCQYCEDRFEPKELNLDHVIPRDKSGRTSWDNVVTSCIPCNTRKANKLPEQARMFPRRPPKAPSWRPLFSTTSRPLPCDSWSHFIDLNEGDVALTE